jgi:hypothetical protein
MLRTWPVRLPAIEFTLSVKSFQVPATPGHLRLAAELAFGADLARDAGHFRGERVELVHHGVERFLQLKDFARHVHGDLLRQVALRHRGRHLGDVAHLAGQVRRHRVDAVGEVLPGAGDAAHQRLAAELAFGADLARDARHFAAKALSWSTMVLMVSFSSRISPRTSTVIFFDRSPLGDRGGHLGDVADLRGQVRRHRVHRVGQVLPGAGDAEHVGLAAERPSVPTSRATRVTSPAKALSWSDHRVDGFLELQDFARHVHRDLLRQVAAGDGGGDVGDVADLAVRLPAMKLTLSVRSFQVPATPGTCAWPPSLPSVPTSRATRVTSEAKR